MKYRRREPSGVIDSSAVTFSTAMGVVHCKLKRRRFSIGLMPLILQVVCVVCRRSPRMMNAAKNILMGRLKKAIFLCA